MKRTRRSALDMPFPGAGTPGGYRLVDGQLVAAAEADARTEPAPPSDAGTEPDTAPRRKNRKE